MPSFQLSLIKEAAVFYCKLKVVEVPPTFCHKITISVGAFLMTQPAWYSAKENFFENNGMHYFQRNCFHYFQSKLVYGQLDFK